jgi:hypothetical protein
MHRCLFSSLALLCVVAAGMTGCSSGNSSSSSSSSGNGSGGSSATSGGSPSTSGGGAGNGAGCAAAESFTGSSLPFSNPQAKLDQACDPGKVDSAKLCATGTCFGPKSGGEGKCIVGCSALKSKPSLGQSCFSGFTCSDVLGGENCVPDAWNICKPGASGSSGTSGTSGTSGSSGSSGGDEECF